MMAIEEACRIILGRNLSLTIENEQGLRWAIVAAMAVATKDDNPEAIEALRRAACNREGER